MTEIAGRGHMSSGWFDCTEPSLTTSVQGNQGLQGAYALVRGGSSASNLLDPEIARCVEVSSGWFDFAEPSLTSFQGQQVCRVLMRWFKHIEPPRTFSNHIIRKVCRGLSHAFGVVRLYRTFCLQGAYALVWGGSSVSDPSRTTSSQR